MTPCYSWHDTHHEALHERIRELEATLDAQHAGWRDIGQLLARAEKAEARVAELENAFRPPGWKDKAFRMHLRLSEREDD